MDREHLEKLNSNSAWKAAFDAALIQAEAVHGEGSADALHYATTHADIAADPTATANVEAAQRAGAENARIEQLLAEARVSKPESASSPSSAEDTPSRIKTGWAKAFGSTSDIPAVGPSQQVEGGTDASPGVGPTNEGGPDIQAAETTSSRMATGWAKAFAAADTRER